MTYNSLKGKKIFAGLSCVMTIVCADLDYIVYVIVNIIFINCLSIIINLS